MSYYNQQPMTPYGGMAPYGGPPPPTGYPPGATTPMTPGPPPPMQPGGPPPYGGGAPSPFGMPLPHGYPPPPAFPPAYPFSLQPSFPSPYGPPSGPPPPPPYFGGSAPFAAHPPPMYNTQTSYPFGQPAPQNATVAHMQHLQPPSAMPPYGAHPQQNGQLMHHPSGGVASGIQLDPFGLPIVSGDATSHFPQRFRVEEKIKSITRDSFIIYDNNNAVRYKVDGLMSIHERKIMKDLQGHVLLKLREARMKMRDKITIYSAQDVPILTLQKASAIQIGSKRVHGYIGGKPTGIPALVITGNTHNTHFRVNNAQNVELADIRRRKFSLKNVLTDQDTYDVNVSYGSPALLCFITIAIDEIYED